MREKVSIWLQRYPLPAAFAGFVVVVAAIQQIVNGLPEFFDDSLPWLGARVNLGEFATSVWQIAWVLPLGIALALLVGIYRATRSAAPLAAVAPSEPDQPATTSAERGDPSSLAAQVPYRLTPRTEAHRFPAGILVKPDQHRVSDLRSFCEARADLIMRGEGLFVDLYKVPITAVTPADERRSFEGLRSWIRACRNHHAAFWSAERYGPRLKPRKVNTIPPWVGTQQDTVQARLHWLKEYGWGCDE